MIEHCIEAYDRILDERRYRAYLTDALMILNENVCQLSGGKTMGARWVDAYREKDTRSAEEIANEIVKKAGLIKKGGEEG